MSCGAQLPAAGPPEIGPAPRRGRSHLPFALVAGVVLVVALVAAGAWLLTRRTPAAITPRLLVARPDLEGQVMLALDLAGKTTPLKLAPVAQSAIGSVVETSGTDLGTFQLRFVSGRQMVHQPWSAAYVWPDGRYGLIEIMEGTEWTLLRFDLGNGEPLEFLRGVSSLSVLVNPVAPRFIAQAEDRHGKNVYTGDVAAGRLVTLIENGDETFAWPGIGWQHVAYVVKNEDVTTFYVARTDGSGARAVEAPTAIKQFVTAITDNGSRVFYVADNVLYRQTIDGREPTRVTFPKGSQVWLLGFYPPRDQMLVVVLADNTATLQLSRTDGSERVNLVRNASRVYAAEFAPDGRHLFAWTGEGEADTLAVFDHQGQNRRELFRGAQSDYVRWLADGRLLYALQERDGRITLYVEDAVGKYKVRLAEDFESLDQVICAPDGYLAYAGVRDGTNALYVVNLKRGQPQLIEESEGGFARVLLASGGRVVYEVRQNNRSSVNVADSNGKNRRVLADDATILGANLYH